MPLDIARADHIERRPHAHAGIIHQNIDPPERHECGAGNGLSPRQRGYRIAARHRLAAKGAYFRRHRLGRGHTRIMPRLGIAADIIDHDIRPARCQQQRMGAPQARLATGAGHNRRLPVKPHLLHHLPFHTAASAGAAPNVMGKPRSPHVPGKGRYPCGPLLRGFLIRRQMA